MSKTKHPDADPFMAIDTNNLANVTGGAARVTARSGAANQELLTMMTQIGDSIKTLASQKNDGGDMMQMMMMMMMMGGGGGGAAQPAPQPQQQLPIINITNSSRRY